MIAKINENISQEIEEFLNDFFFWGIFVLFSIWNTLGLYLVWI